MIIALALASGIAPLYWRREADAALATALVLLDRED